MIFQKYELEEFRGIPQYNKCPHCKRENVFQRYVYIKTKVHVANDVGRCTGKKKECGYYYTADEYFQDNPNLSPAPLGVNAPASLIPQDHFRKSLGRYDENNFVDYLRKEFGKQATERMVERYAIGTSNNCKGGTIFWHIDSEDNVRTGKIRYFNTATGKQTLYPYSCQTWIHRFYNSEKFNLIDCFFGEHLLKNETSKTVVVLYSEKEAVIGSFLYPEYLFIALCNGRESADSRMCQTLSNRTVIWFPKTGFEKLQLY
jgi:hypothetical protein